MVKTVMEHAGAAAAAENGRKHIDKVIAGKSPQKGGRVSGQVINTRRRVEGEHGKIRPADTHSIDGYTIYENAGAGSDPTL